MRLCNTYSHVKLQFGGSPSCYKVYLPRGPRFQVPDFHPQAKFWQIRRGRCRHSEHIKNTDKVDEHRISSQRSRE